MKKWIMIYASILRNKNAGNIIRTKIRINVEENFNVLFILLKYGEEVGNT